MASTLRTKLRIAASVLLAPGFWDAVAGRFLFQPSAPSGGVGSDVEESGHGWQDLRGALHVHSTYSDGASDIPTIMAAAREADVDFVLLTDHNTQRPLRDGWESRFSGDPRLVIGTEVTIEHGAFLLALDMPPAWEPTKHQPPQVAVDEVNAQGGLPLVSLPFDVKHPWQDWEVRGYAGLEVINLSTVARRHINLLSLLWLLPVYKRQGILACLRALVTRPDRELALWDRLTASGRSLVGIGALDAHALMKIGRKKYPFPSYADSFRAATTHVLVHRGSDHDREAIHDALRAGRCYFSYDCLADPTGFTFRAAGVTGEVIMGERVSLGPSGREGVRLAACAPRIGGGRVLLRLLRNAEIVAASTGGALTFTAAVPGAYRVEAYRYARRAGPLFIGARPWLFSNPIYIAAEGASGSGANPGTPGDA